MCNTFKLLYPDCIFVLSLTHAVVLNPSSGFSLLGHQTHYWVIFNMFTHVLGRSERCWVIFFNPNAGFSLLVIPEGKFLNEIKV